MWKHLVITLNLSQYHVTLEFLNTIIVAKQIDYHDNTATSVRINNK